MAKKSTCSDKISLQHYKVTTRFVVTRNTPVVTLYGSFGIFLASKSPVLHKTIAVVCGRDPPVCFTKPPVHGFLAIQGFV